jgi:hypothetical protein
VGSGGASDITFSAIPSTYTHLQIRGIARSARALYLDGLWIQFNGDTGANYSSHVAYGSGSSVSGFSTSNSSTPQCAVGIAGATSPANVFGANILDILDYASTSKNKTLRALSGIDNNGSGEIDFGSMARYNTAAITSVRLFNESGTNFQQYTQFALYGIKG